ncbi:hypothetical protein ACFROC_19155 [Nocardia tengchongensis]|uniref:hypothetical protein n=1 Tax=Nocardia tengchongensis TaxID=2055889 RepID=UPI00367FC254
MTTFLSHWDAGRSYGDVASAIGMAEPGSARTALFTEAAITASIHAEQLAIGPNSPEFLARCVRSLGTDGALRLPEPLIDEAPTTLVHAWISAAQSNCSPDGLRDGLFAPWLETVTMLLALRRTATATSASAPVTDQLTGSGQ